MPLRKKKWTGSKANNYISRGKACSLLQISLPAFRKLSILKGIYPHDPKKKHRKEGIKRIYYHLKDIKFLRREPILWKYRQQRAFRDKITKHKARHNWDKVKRMTKNTPQVKLDHLIRERYPRFHDALLDLDDALTLVHLFASIRAGKVKQLTSDRRMRCQRLCKEFQNYVAACGLLTKAFVSVKGIYYQARLRKKYDITWIVPHQFTHELPNDVDYKVMSTFLEFYELLIKFANIHLYKKSNFEYPPFGEISFDLTNMSLSTLRKNASRFRPSRQVNNDNNNNNNNDNNNNDNNSKNKTVILNVDQILKDNNNGNRHYQDTAIINNTKNNNKSDRSTLFSSYKFLINRETPQLSLEFIILSMGGEVIFQQECTNENDTTVTHQIVDRNIDSNKLLPTREYIQPQWVYDCLNTGIIIPTEHYQIGVQCPPHLSPFISDQSYGYKPSQAYVLDHWKELAKQYGDFSPAKKLGKNETSNNNNDDDNDNDIDNDILLTGDNKNELDGTIDMDMNEILNEVVIPNENISNESLNDNKDNNNNNKNNNINNNNNNNNKDTLSKKSKQKLLEQQRLQISQQRRTQEKKIEQETVTQEEREKEQLAKAMMPKRHRKFYNKIQKKKTLSKHYVNKLEHRRSVHESKLTK